MIVHKERHAYDAAKDPVATMTLTVECNPGQVEHIAAFLMGVTKQAGIYSVDISDHTVAVPEQAAQPEAQGETHGEPSVLTEHIDPEATGDGEGSPPEESRPEAPGPDSGENGSVAGPAGEVATEGQSLGDAGGEDLRESDGLAGR